MHKLNILNKKKVKEILKKIDDQWGTTITNSEGKDTTNEYVFLEHEKGKIFIIKKDIDKIDFQKLRINSMGLYLGDQTNENTFRVSIEGSQLIGPTAKKNVLEITKEEARAWLKGEDIVPPAAKDHKNTFVILKQENDFLGSGKVKDGKILNFVPKIRRLHCSD